MMIVCVCVCTRKNSSSPVIKEKSSQQKKVTQYIEEVIIRKQSFDNPQRNIWFGQRS